MMLSHLLKLVCFFLATFLILSQAGDWTYSAAKTWKNDYATCGVSNQSPINIETAKVVEDTSKAVSLSGWDVKRPTITHYHRKNDHTTLYRTDDMPASMTINGKILKLYAVYYHWGSDSSKGSEHKVNGQSYAGEAQMLFYDKTSYQNVNRALEADGGVAVLSYLLNENKELKKDRPIMEHYKKNVIKLASKEELIVKDTSNRHSLNGALLTDMSAYRYTGSLPFPPCKAMVEWVIVKKPMDVTTSFMTALRALKQKDGTTPLGDNFRPTQDLGGREVYDVKVTVLDTE